MSSHIFLANLDGLSACHTRTGEFLILMKPYQVEIQFYHLLQFKTMQQRVMVLLKEEKRIQYFQKYSNKYNSRRMRNRERMAMSIPMMMVMIRKEKFLSAMKHASYRAQIRDPLKSMISDMTLLYGGTLC
jgi:hypothetical protein